MMHDDLIWNTCKMHRGMSIKQSENVLHGYYSWCTTLVKRKCVKKGLKTNIWNSTYICMQHTMIFSYKWKSYSVQYFEIYKIKLNILITIMTYCLFVTFCYLKLKFNYALGNLLAYLITISFQLKQTYITLLLFDRLSKTRLLRRILFHSVS